MKTRENEIQKLPFPRGVLESMQVETARKAYKVLGKDPARYRGSAEALLRRVVAGEGMAQVYCGGGGVNILLGGKTPPGGLFFPARGSGGNVFFGGGRGEKYKGSGKADF